MFKSLFVMLVPSVASAKCWSCASDRAATPTQEWIGGIVVVLF
jgi:hypothetical protein